MFSVLPFKGEVGWGMGSKGSHSLIRLSNPIPALSLPLKGRKRSVAACGPRFGSKILFYDYSIVDLTLALGFFSAFSALLCALSVGF
jgi:hypothetical protein